MDETRRVARMRRILLVLSLILITIIIGLGVYFVSTNAEGQLMSQPLNMTSVTHKWFCKNGRAFTISSSKVVAVCRGEYVDIRQVINHKATIKGIQLTLPEWKQLNDIINDVNDIL